MKCPKCQADNPETKPFCADCGTPLPSPKEHRPLVTETLQTPVKELTRGTLFARRFEIIEELGKGGMGKVYRVFDKKVGEEVALKLIKPEIAAERDVIDRFRSELKMSRKISHRNVSRMYDLGDEEGTYFITMEYVPGEDLKSFIHRSKQLNTGTAISIARQVAEGLDEAHRLGVVHRDLKPSNIMIDKEGNAKIMDFGIARSLSGKGITGAGVMIGTPEYMSPEQVEGKEADQRSDIYSLGLILYEMVTGRRAFEGDTPLSIAHKQRYEAPTDPKKLNTQIPDDLSREILRCLEKDRTKRPQTAGEVISDLGKIEQGLPTTERVAPARKPFTSKEITVKFSLKKLVFPGLAVVAFIVAAVIIIWRVLPKKEAVSAAAAPPSIAVLPFVDDSPEKGHEYLCEGIPSTLINALNTIQDLRTPARTSSFAFAGKGLDIQGIGQKLNVENILEGSIQVVENSLRVTASLIKVKDGYQLWNATYDRRLEDVFAIQDEIAQAIVKALKVRLLGGQEERLVKRHTENTEAYRLYLEGLYYWNKRTGKDLNKAIELFNQATDNDPNYALAYVGLADSYSLLTLYADARPTEVFPQAKAAAVKALELNESLAEAHNSLAYIYERYDWNWKGAEAEFKRALELNPNCAPARFWYGEFLSYSGRFEEALREMKRALELDPVSLIIHASVAWTHLMAQQADQALAQIQKTIEMEPNFAYARLILGLAYVAKGRYAEAIEEHIKARALSGDSVMATAALGMSYAAAGELDEAKGILEELKARSQKQYVSSYWIAALYGAMGDADKAIEMVNKAYEERSDWLINLKVGLSLGPYHRDPRTQALLKLMGLD